ncbi:MAG: prolyl hydroxylase family protein [Povalibacter sp.]
MSKNKPLDAAWRRWLKENLDRKCDPQELSKILRSNGFSAAAIQQALKSLAPAAVESIPIHPQAGSAVAGQLDGPWQSWLKENLQRGCDPQGLLETLLKHGFTEESIMRSLAIITGDLESSGAMSDESSCDYEAIAQPPLLRRASTPQLQRVPSDSLQLFTFDDFMSAAECDAIVEIANHHLRPSTVTVESGDKYYRTSRTCDLSLLNSSVVAALDLKIATTLGIRPEYSEGIQAQRYDVGEQFKKHTDYFEPGTTEYARFAAERGNRTWTFMVYLNEGMEGGGTRFVNIERTFQPKKGQAVLWNNLYADGTPNHDTLHSGEPVTRGHKIIITKWFRENGLGPMFFDA